MNAIRVVGTGAPVNSANAIGSLVVVDGQHRNTVVVTWIAGSRKGRRDIVDLSPLIDTHKFYALLRRDVALFNTVRVIDDGFAIAWGDGAIDMSASSVARLAEEAMTGSDFNAFLKRNALTHQAAAAALGRSKRQIEHYLQYDALPRMVVLACLGYEARREILDQCGFCGGPVTATETFSKVEVSYQLPAQRYAWHLPVSIGAVVKGKTCVPHE